MHFGHWSMLATSPVLPRPSIPFTSVHAHHVKHESSVHIRRPSSAFCTIYTPPSSHCRTLYLPAPCCTLHLCCSIITLPARPVDMALVILFLRVPCFLRSSDLPCRCPPVLRNRRSIRETIRCLPPFTLRAARFDALSLSLVALGSSSLSFFHSWATTPIIC